MYTVTDFKPDHEPASAYQFVNPYDAVAHLQGLLTDLKGDFESSCEEHCACHSTCDWCDSAAEVDKALTAVTDGTTAERLSNGKSSSWTFIPPVGPVISFRIS